MALPELGTPINRNILEKAIHAKIAPVRLKALEGLIYNDLAFTFYNRVEAGKIALSKEGATVISLEDKDIALWEMYTRYQFESDIHHYPVDVEKVLLDTIAKSAQLAAHVQAAERRKVRDLRLHQALLQPGAPPLDARQQEPRQARARCCRGDHLKTIAAR